jgi:hypothetical protein
MAKWVSYSEEDAPQFILDDLGLFHDREIPLPSVYIRDPCKCGIIHKWEQPDTFELYSLQMVENGDDMGFDRKKVKRCIMCKQILLLKKELNSPELPISDL